MTAAEAVRVFLDALEVPAGRLPQTVDGQLGLYRSLLTGRRMLVVLDNARDVAQVRPLLPGAPTCRIIVTSRSQLTGLAAIEAARPLILDVLSAAEARQLLQHRLGAGRLAAEPAAAAQTSARARACRSRCGHRGRCGNAAEPVLAQVAADLAGGQDLDALADGDDPAADVRAAFSWSYRQLDAGAARVFRLAGLLPGPDLDAMRWLRWPDDLWPSRPGLDVLARACMIQPAGQARYGLHDLLRGYARELGEVLDGEHERRAALTGLFDYYLYTAATAMDAAFPAERHRRPRIPAPPAPIPHSQARPRRWHGWTPSGPAWWRSRRARGLAEQGWPADATGLSATLFRYLDTQGPLHRRPPAIHTHACSAGPPRRRLGSRGRCRQQPGRHASAARPLPAGLRTLRAGLDALPADREPVGRSASAVQPGLHRLPARPPRAGGRSPGPGPGLVPRGRRPVGEARTLASLGYVHLRQGHYAQAVSHLQQSLILCQQVGDRGGEGRALGNLGEVELRLHHYQQATAHVQQALALFQEIGDRISEADTLTSLGLIDLRQGRHEQAAEHLRHALPSATRPVTCPAALPHSLVWVSCYWPRDATPRRANGWP